MAAGARSIENPYRPATPECGLLTLESRCRDKDFDMPDKRKPQSPEAEQERAARRSGRLGADKPSYSKEKKGVRREADKKPNPEGPQFEEGGQYPGVRGPSHLREP